MSQSNLVSSSDTRRLPRADFTSICEVARNFGLSPATDPEIEQAQVMASRLIGTELTSVADLQALQRVFPASVLVHRTDGEVTGVFAYMLLRPEALPAVWTGALDPLELDLGLCALPDEPVGGVYSLGFAGSTKPAGQAVVIGAWDLSRRLYAAVPSFTRAATDVGRHIVTQKLGYKPVAEGSDIYWFDAVKDAEAAA